MRWMASKAFPQLCDTHVRIPMLGRKHSLNVATAGGVVIYELLRKYRETIRPSESKAITGLSSIRSAPWVVDDAV